MGTARVLVLGIILCTHPKILSPQPQTIEKPQVIHAEGDNCSPVLKCDYSSYFKAHNFTPSGNFPHWRKNGIRLDEGFNTTETFSMLNINVTSEANYKCSVYVNEDPRFIESDGYVVSPSGLQRSIFIGNLTESTHYTAMLWKEVTCDGQNSTSEIKIIEFETNATEPDAPTALGSNTNLIVGVVVGVAVVIVLIAVILIVPVSCYKKWSWIRNCRQSSKEQGPLSDLHTLEAAPGANSNSTEQHPLEDPNVPDATGDDVTENQETQTPVSTRPLDIIPSSIHRHAPSSETLETVSTDTQSGAENCSGLSVFYYLEPVDEDQECSTIPTVEKSSRHVTQATFGKKLNSHIPL